MLQTNNRTILTMNLTRDRFKEIAGLDVTEADMEADIQISEDRAITFLELQRSARELFGKLGLYNPNEDQLSALVQALVSIIKQSIPNVQLGPTVKF